LIALEFVIAIDKTSSKGTLESLEILKPKFSTPIAVVNRFLQVDF